MADKPSQGSPLSISFREKVATVFTLLITLVMLLSVYLVTYQVKVTSLARAEESGRLLGKIIALSMGEDIIRGNLQSISYALNEFVKLEKIEYCLILDNMGRVMSSTDEQMLGRYFSDAWSRSALVSPEMSIRRAARGNRPVYDASVPIEIGGKRHALIRVGFTLGEELASIRNLLVYNLSLGLALILVGIFIAYAVSSTLLSPLNAIMNSIESMNRGDFSQKAHISSADEFEQLAISFNKLSNFLEKKGETDKFISQKLWESDPGLKHKHFSGKNIDAVVLYLELNRFSSFVERHSPSEAIDTLNAFFEQTTETIALSGGYIDKFGDASVAAVFPLISGDRWPAFLRAAFAALSARANLAAFNFKQAQLGLEGFDLRIGMASGRIIIGNIGTTGRSDFSALGQTVNAAKKAAESASLNNEFRPIATSELVRCAADFLAFNRIETQNSSFDLFSLQGFTNLAYFKEKLPNVSERGSLSIIKAFGLTESDDGIDFLEKCIEDPNGKYRLEAVKALAPALFYANARAEKILLNLIEKDEDQQLTALSVSVLGWKKDKKLVPVFSKLFEHSDDRVRANAVEACVPIDFPDKREIFKKLLKDRAPRVCANALLGLWLADDQETLSCLYSLLKADDAKKRASGAFAVYFLAASRRFRRMFPAYSEDSNFVILPIIENILQRLKAMLESSESSERFQALRAAGKIGYSQMAASIRELTEFETEPEIISLAHSILKEWESHNPPADSLAN